MTEIETIGISLVLDNGVAEGMQRLQRDLAAFDQGLGERTARLQRLAERHLAFHLPRHETMTAGAPPAVRPRMREARPHGAAPAAEPAPPRDIARAAPVAERPAQPQRPRLPPATSTLQAVAPRAARPASPQTLVPGARPVTRTPPSLPSVAAPQRAAPSQTNTVGLPAQTAAMPQAAPRPRIAVHLTPPIPPPLTRAAVPHQRATAPAPPPAPRTDPLPTDRAVNAPRFVASTRPPGATVPSDAAHPPPRPLPATPGPPTAPPARPQPRPHAGGPWAAPRPASPAPAPVPNMAPRSPPPLPLPSPPLADHRAEALPPFAPRALVPAPPAEAPPPSPQTPPDNPISPDASSGTIQGELMIDGVQIGRWLAETMARQAAQPPSAARRFNSRMMPAWPGMSL